MTTTNATIEMRLADLQRAVDVGNATTAGQLQLLVQRSDQTERRMDGERRWAESEFARVDRQAAAEETERTASVTALGVRMSAIERRSAAYIGAAAVLSAGAGSLLTHLLTH